jgi:hypothetical protein
METAWFLDLKLLLFYSFRYLFYFISFDVTATELLLKHQVDAEEVTLETELLRLKLYCILTQVCLFFPLSLSL